MKQEWNKGPLLGWELSPAPTLTLTLTLGPLLEWELNDKTPGALWEVWSLITTRVGVTITIISVRVSLIGSACTASTPFQPNPDHNVPNPNLDWEAKRAGTPFQSQHDDQKASLITDKAPRHVARGDFRKHAKHDHTCHDQETRRPSH